MKTPCRYFSLSIPSEAQISQITRLYRQAGWWTGTDDNPTLISGMVAGSHIFQIAVIRDTIIGMGRVISDGISDAYIQDVTVDTAYRGRGIGSTIIKKLVARVEKDGLRWIGLIAEAGSHAFYRPFGFKKMQDSTPMLKT